MKANGNDDGHRKEPSIERDAAIEARNTNNATPTAPDGNEEKSLCTSARVPLLWLGANPVWFASIPYFRGAILLTVRVIMVL